MTVTFDGVRLVVKDASDARSAYAYIRCLLGGQLHALEMQAENATYETDDGELGDVPELF